MKKPKVYINDLGHLVVVFPKQYSHNHCRVLIVHDRGPESYHRYQTHPATAYGDTGRSYPEDILDTTNMIEYMLARKTYVKGGDKDEV